MLKQQSYYITTQSVKALIRIENESGGWDELQETDEFEYVDEEERSELEEIEEDRRFYSSHLAS